MEKTCKSCGTKALYATKDMQYAKRTVLPAEVEMTAEPMRKSEELPTTLPYREEGDDYDQYTTAEELLAIEEELIKELAGEQKKNWKEMAKKYWWLIALVIAVALYYANKNSK